MRAGCVRLCITLARRASPRVTKLSSTTKWSRVAFLRARILHLRIHRPAGLGLLWLGVAACAKLPGKRLRGRKPTMTWTTPTLVEICIGLEINGYLPAEF